MYRQEYPCRGCSCSTDGAAPLVAALSRHGDDSGRLVALLAAGARPGEADEHGVSPLVLAAHRGFHRAVGVLLRAGADPDYMPRCERTALMLAAQLGHKDCVKALIEGGVNVNTTNRLGELALHYAAASGSVSCVDLLLKVKAKVNYPDTEGNTPLIRAAKGGHVATIKRLLAGGAKPDKTDRLGRTPLHWVATNGPAEAAQMLISGGAGVDSLDKCGVNPFFLAVMRNQTGVLAELVEAGCERVTVDGLAGTALGLSAVKGREACVRILLEAGDPPDEPAYFSMTPLMAASFEGHTAITTRLLKARADPNKTGRQTSMSALIMAIVHMTSEHARSRHRIIAQLIAHGADVNCRVSGACFFTVLTHGRNCALSCAITSGYVSVVRMLLVAGCDVDLQEVLSWRTSTSVLGKKAFDISPLIDPIIEWKTQPPTLLHACRAAIRRHLASDQSTKMTQATDQYTKIGRLPLPRALKSYLRLDELGEGRVERVWVPEGAGPMMAEFVSVPLCGMRALEGTHLFSELTRNNPLSDAPCMCDQCLRMRDKDSDDCLG